MKTQQINNELLAIQNLIMINKELFAIHVINEKLYEENLESAYKRIAELMKINKEEK